MGECDLIPVKWHELVTQVRWIAACCNIVRSVEKNDVSENDELVLKIAVTNQMRAGKTDTDVNGKFAFFDFLVARCDFSEIGYPTSVMDEHKTEWRTEEM